MFIIFLKIQLCGMGYAKVQIEKEEQKVLEDLNKEL